MSSTVVAPASAAENAPVLEVDYLSKHFKVDRGTLTAVSNVSLTLRPGETVALVGESGSGKSTLARCVVSLLAPSEGVVAVAGRAVEAGRGRGKRSVYKNIQMVFQDANGSLNPRWRVDDILAEPLRRYSTRDAAQRATRIRELLAQVELDESLLRRRPSELSGGQRQRVGIARALAVEPKVLVLDEPTASLDVSTRGQVLELLRRIQQETGLAYLLISHDLQAVRYVADRVLVMYLGSIVESGPAKAVFADPKHPYTRALVAAAPVAAYRSPRADYRLTGEIPSPVDLPPGCLLAGRCPSALDSCFQTRPDLVDIGSRRQAACPVLAPPVGPVG